MPLDVKVGDVVHVRGTVTRISKVASVVDVEFKGDDARTICVDQIVHVEPRPLHVGDKVRCKGGSEVARVLARDGDTLWVKWELDGSRGSWHDEVLVPA